MATRAKSETRSPEEFVEHEYRLMSSGDVEGLLDLRTDDIVEEFVPVGTFRGKDEVRRFATELFTAFPDFSVSALRVSGDENRVFSEWRATATHTGGPFQGIEPTGRSMELHGVDVFELRDGLISRTTVYYDGMAAARGFGMMPPQGSGGERAMIAGYNALTRLRTALRERASR